MVLMGDFNHPSIGWKENTAEQQQSNWLLEHVDNNFLFQVVEKKGAMLDLVLINEDGLVSNMTLKGSLDYSDHEMMEFKILRVSKVCGKLTTLDFKKQNSNFSGNCMVGQHGIKPWREEGPKKAGQYSRTISSKSRSSTP